MGLAVTETREILSLLYFKIELIRNDCMDFFISIYSNVFDFTKN